MFFVRTGRLVMVRILESGQELVVQRADPGDLFAEASLFQTVTIAMPLVKRTFVARLMTRLLCWKHSMIQPWRC